MMRAQLVGVVVIPNPGGIAMIHHRVNQVGEAITEAVASDARDYAAVETGRMRTSIRSTYSNALQRGRVYVGTGHWHFIEYGTRPHRINPRIKKALWWGPKKNSFGLAHPIATVWHPGNRPMPFMRPAVWKPRAFHVSVGGIVSVT